MLKLNSRISRKIFTTVSENFLGGLAAMTENEKRLIQQIYEKVSAMEKKVDKLDNKIDKLDGRMDNLEVKMDSLEGQIKRKAERQLN
ncbi:hypothetical protein BAPA111461_17205 [Bacillus paramycoides]